MKPASCKNKGRRFQQRIARSILEAFPHLEEDDVVSTSMGAGGEDVRLSAAARRALPVSIECKCVEKLNVWSCLEQATRNAPGANTPCLVFSRNRSPTYAVVPWETLLDLYRRVHHHQPPSSSSSASPLPSDGANEEEGERFGQVELPAGLGDALVQLGEFVDAERAKRRRFAAEEAKGAVSKEDGKEKEDPPREPNVDSEDDEQEM